MSTQSSKREIFARNLRSALASSYLNQAQLADICGVSRGTMSDWYHGRAYPRPEKLSLLANALGVTEYDLTVDFDSTKKIPYMNRELSEIAAELNENPDARRLYAAITQLKEEDKLAVQHIVYKLSAK